MATARKISARSPRHKGKTEMRHHQLAAKSICNSIASALNASAPTESIDETATANGGECTHIVNTLRDAGVPLSIMAIADLTKISRGDLCYLLSMLTQLGKIERSVGERGRYFYSVPTDKPPSVINHAAVTAHDQALNALATYVDTRNNKMLTALVSTVTATWNECALKGKAA